MAIPSVVQEALARGVSLRVVEGKVRMVGPEAEVDALLPRVRDEKEALLLYFAREPHHQRLCRFLDEVVETKYGRGRLWQVFEDRAAVVLQPGRLTFMHPTDIYLDPPAGP
jgi:hypothetical protein